MRCRPSAPLLGMLLLWIASPIATADPVRMTVSPAGEIQLSLDGRPVASGRWCVRSEAYLPSAGAAAINPGAVVTSTAVQDRPGHASVHQTYAAMTADFTFDLHGEDLRIASHVVNNDPAHAVRPIAFSGLTFHFNPAVPLAGQMVCWHWTYLAAQKLQLFHPSVPNPVGCWWASDDRFGISAFSESEFDRSVLITAEFVDKNGAIPAECQPAVFTERSVPPAGSVDVTCSIRVSADRAMPHLLEPYKAVYDRHFPLPLYWPDNRGVAMFSEVDSQHVSRSNPLGYHGPGFRFDTAFGTASYLQRYPDADRRAGFVGHIFWALGGYSPPMYTPEFDVFPPPVQANVAKLVKGFHDRGLRIGLCTRPGDGVLRQPGTDPAIYRLSADDPEQMRVDMDRFRHAMAMGFDMFYMDSIGDQGLNDVRIIRNVRDTVGAGALLYTEYCTDMSLPYAGRYCEWLDDGSIRWNSPDNYAALRMLCPRATWLCVSKTHELIPASFAKLALTPLVLDQYMGRVPAADDSP